MIKIKNEIIKNQKNYWNAAVFHPTDAVEDPWGRRILDRISEDGALKTVRIYSMFEDIVYLDENGKLCYDFRLSDLRLDYLISKGYNLLIAYAGIPDCIAASTANKTSVAKNKTRYKGKMWNTYPPKDYAVWEELCYEYTRHIVERYGIERVSDWRLQCFNEPDIPAFFFSDRGTEEDIMEYRLPAYCKLYEAFERGIRRVSEKLRIGGPVLANKRVFLGGFLDFIKGNNLKLDFISVHNYGGVSPSGLNSGAKKFNVQNSMNTHMDYAKVVREHGFGDVPLLVDEWGMASAGFYNREECPDFIARENEVFSAYFAKLIHAFTYSDYKTELLCICLSGQHEMTEDFSGFRNFFTLNFIAKPIYNAYILLNKLGENVLASTCGENCFVLPTTDKNENYAVMVTYSSESFEEALPDVKETVTFETNITGKTVSVWCIDKNHTNPYRLWERGGFPEISGEVLKQLKEEGRLKPIASFVAESNSVELDLTANATFLITTE